jgi:CheY-like chemotaxis protein
VDFDLLSAKTELVSSPPRASLGSGIGSTATPDGDPPTWLHARTPEALVAMTIFDESPAESRQADMELTSVPGACGHSVAPLAEIVLIQSDWAQVQQTLDEAAEHKLLNQITVLTNSEDAAEYLRREGPHARAPIPDVVLLDLKLPRRAGYDLLRLIRRSPALAGVTVAALGRPETVEACSVDAYLDRPVIPELLELVSTTRDLHVMVVRRFEGSAS